MPKQHFCIWIVSPPGYLHGRCFEEVAIGLQSAFAALGYEVPIIIDPAQIKDYGIVLGANLLPRIAGPLPERLILYNLEQIQDGSTWLKPVHLELFKRYPVWDYSQRNIAKLLEFGVRNVTHLGIGYMPALTRIKPQAEDIDVFFAGSESVRRIELVGKLTNLGINAVWAYNAYGSERDALIARAKIVLNMHYYDVQVFEIVRVSYLLANRKCVVSEPGMDADLEAPVRDGIAFTPYADLPTTCVRLLKDRAERARIAGKGFECFRALSQVEMLKRVLESMDSKLGGR